MWCRCLILLTFSGLSLATLETTHICNGMREDDVEKNPLDCNSYFICGKTPILRYCEKGLQFDAERKVCNWPEYARCQLEINLPEKLISDSHVVMQQFSKKDSKIEADNDRGEKPQPIFVAIDTETGQAVDPMSKYDPSAVECRHFGAYFLPHPRDCQKYYICAYGHLLRHRCGPGTVWNYKLEECELRNDAICYGKSVLGGLQAQNEEGLKPTSKPIYQGTICYPVYIGEEGFFASMDTGTTWIPTGTTPANPTGTTWNPTGTTWNPTPPVETLKPFNGGIHVPTASSSSTTSNSGRSGPDCPLNQQAYRPDADDCSKYYICISGKPVHTSCPEGLLWDVRAEFCDLPKNVQCYQA